MTFNEFIFTYAMEVCFPLLILAFAWVLATVVAQCMYQLCPTLCIGVAVNLCLVFGIVVGVLGGWIMVSLLDEALGFEKLLQWLSGSSK